MTIRLTNSSKKLVISSRWRKIFSRCNWHLDGDGYAVSNSKIVVNGEYRYWPAQQLVLWLKDGILSNIESVTAGHADQERKNYQLYCVDSNIRAEDKRLANIHRRKHGQNGHVPSSEFRGVRLHGQGNKWEAQLGADKIKYYLGLYSLEEQASVAWQAAFDFYEEHRQEIIDHLLAGHLDHVRSLLKEIARTTAEEVNIFGSESDELVDSDDNDLDLDIYIEDRLS